MERPRLAVVIPAYNEEARLGSTLDAIAAYLGAQGYPWEAWVVDDGSTDGTSGVAEGRAASEPSIRLLRSAPNRGKGHAVCIGMLQADADFLLLSDADLATPVEEVEKLWAALEGADLAIGSRPLKESRLEIRQPFYREALGRLFNLAVQALAVPGIRDTQCGFKLFPQAVARDVFSRCKLDGFGYDFEALMVARDLGYRIAEVPVRWRHQEGSKVVLLRDGPRMLADLVRLRLAGKKGRLSPAPARLVP